MTNFDNLTELALKIFQVPVSVVSIVNENNALKSSGEKRSLKEVDFSKNLAPLNHSFCKYVFDLDIVVCENDISKPGSRMENLSMFEQGLVSYLGAPIRSTLGRSIGTFFLLSGRPREWTNSDKENAGQLARCAAEIYILKSALTENSNAVA